MNQMLFEPTTEQRKEIADWFSEYDQLTKSFEFEKMADRGIFPMYVITDNSQGDGVTRTWSRTDFISSMKNSMENTPADIEYNTVRKPFMISPNLAIVFTEWHTVKESDSQILKYADILLKENGMWKFQTMIQGGWGDFLMS